MASLEKTGTYVLSLEEAPGFLCQISPVPHDATVWLTVSLPVYETEQLFLSHAKSAIQKALRSSPKVSENKNASQAVREYLLHQMSTWRVEQVRDNTTAPTGLVIYFSFDPEELNHISATKIEDKTQLYLASLDTPIDDTWSYAGSSYHLGPVVWSRQRVSRWLTVLISQESTNLLWIDNNQSTEIETIENIYTTEPHNRYIEKMSVTENKSLLHGTGSDKVQRQQESGNKLYLRSVFDAVLEHVQSKSLVSGVHVCYPPAMSVVVEELAGDSLKDTLHLPAHLEARILSSDTIPVKDFMKQYNQWRRDDLRTLLETAKDDQLFLTDFKEGVDALRNHQLKTLFLPPEQNLPGYVTGDGLVYAESIPDAEKVADITPWLLRTAHLAGTTVIRSSLVRELMGDQLYGVLRYRSE